MSERIHREIFFEIILASIILIFFGYTGLHTDEWCISIMPATLGPAFFPAIACSVIVLMSTIILVTHCLSLNNLKNGKSDIIILSMKYAEKEKTDMKMITAYIILLFIYLILFYYIGFIKSTPFIMIAIAYMLGLRKYIIPVFIVFIAFTFFLDYASFIGLQIILPDGELFVQ